MAGLALPSAHGAAVGPQIVFFSALLFGADGALVLDQSRDDLIELLTLDRDPFLFVLIGLLHEEDVALRVEANLNRLGPRGFRNRNRSRLAVLRATS